MISDNGFIIGRNRLFEFLREKKIFNDCNIPYQKYIDQKYFLVTETKFQKNNENHISFKTLVFQKGINFIIKQLKESKEGNK